MNPEDPLAPVGEPVGDEGSIAPFGHGAGPPFGHGAGGPFGHGAGTPFGHGAGDAARYRQVLGHFATGVTVVTTVSEGVPAGLSVNSFTSVSLEPPLVAFCVARTSSTWPRIQAVGTFCVNILAEDQEDLCRVFATSTADKFRGVGWRPAESGAPILAGALAWIDCSVEAEHPAGDHVIVVGRVRELGVAREGRPLVFYRGGYGRFEP